MNNSLSKIFLRPSAGSSSTFDMSAQCLTTSNFGELNCLYSVECLPGDSFTVRPKIFSRMAPLAVPTYGRANWHTVGVFVPSHAVAFDFADYAENIRMKNGRQTVTRYFTLGTLCELFLTGDVSDRVQDPSTEHYDFVYRLTASASPDYYRFQSKGRYVYRVLKQLGYDIVGDVVARGISTVKLNAIPLISFFKAYYDFLSRQSIYNTNELSKVLYAIRMLSDSNYVRTSTGELTLFCLGSLFESLFLTYDADYFTTAFRHPGAVVSASASSAQSNYYFEADHVGSNGVHTDVVNMNEQGTFMGQAAPPSDYANIVDARGIEYLQRLAKWLTRNNFVGGKLTNRILAHYGVKPSSESQDMCDFIGDSVTSVQIGDITSLADTSDSQGGKLLGSYAGKGIVSDDNGEFKFSCDEYGTFFVFGYLTVEPIWSEGFDRSLLHIDPFDFHTPDLDGMQASPVSMLELFNRRKTLATDDPLDFKEAFGFHPLYQEYRQQRSRVSGDFVTDEGLNSWFFERALPQAGDGVTDYKAQASWVNSYNTYYNGQYNHIFTVTDPDVDHFYITAYIDASARRRVLSSSEATGLPQGDKSFVRNGK